MTCTRFLGDVNFIRCNQFEFTICCWTSQYKIIVVTKTFWLFNELLYNVIVLQLEPDDISRPAKTPILRTELNIMQCMIRVLLGLCLIMIYTIFWETSVEIFWNITAKDNYISNDQFVCRNLVFSVVTSFNEIQIVFDTYSLKSLISSETYRIRIISEVQLI